MTISQLSYALALHKYQSFNQAAAKLSITQPALSLQISKLEKELGVQLFERGKNKVTATSEGEEFILRAKEIVQKAEDLRDFAIELTEKISGPLKLGIIPTLSPFLAPLFIKPFKEAYLEVSLDISEVITADVINGVLDGTFDAGIISTPVKAAGIFSEPLFYEKFYLYSSERVDEATSTLKAIDYSRLWLLNEGNCFRDQVNNFCDLKKIRKNKNLIYRSNSIDALIRIVDSQGGMTILPELTTLILEEAQEERTRLFDHHKPQ
ncbi:MAG: LysR substrate-binding domain-containing protein, partial [Fulvivirga sp.]|nr:LysR substrate-binding domain-containing protein [Fulvivirga sp.]